MMNLGKGRSERRASSIRVALGIAAASLLVRYGVVTPKASRLRSEEVEWLVDQLEEAWREVRAAEQSVVLVSPPRRLREEEEDGIQEVLAIEGKSIYTATPEDVQAAMAEGGDDPSGVSP